MVAPLLEQAISEVAKLPKDRQEVIARKILEQLSEWRSESEPAEQALTLREMLEQARRDHREGRTEELDPDNL